jgi:hypothetical protein
MPKLTSGVLLLLLGCVSAFSQQPPPSPTGLATGERNRPGALRQIIPGHYLSELHFADQFLFINDGYGLDWLRALDEVEALGADIFVPGHGPIPADPRETRQGLRRFRQMLADVRDAVQKEIARGATEDQAVAAIRWPQYEKMQGYATQRETAVRRLYQQLTGKLP